MKIYTLIPRISGYVSDWIKLVPHIASLGFDTIHLLPITKMGKSLSPYSSANPYVIDPMYDEEGSSERALVQFRKFIDCLNTHNIRLCVDIVLNHLSVDHPLLHEYKEWTYTDDKEQDAIKRAGWHDGEQWHKWDDLALLNYEDNINTTLWDYMYNYAAFWAEFAKETGGFIRLDNLHSSYKGFTEYALSQIKIRYPEVRLFSELFADEDTIRTLLDKYNFSFLLATQWEHKFGHQLKEYLKYIHSDTFSVRYVCPVLSHDSGSITGEYGSLRSSVPRMVVSALMTSGDWGIVQGVEYGLEQKQSFIGEKSERAWAEEYGDAIMPYADIIQTLNSLINEYECFRDKSNIAFLQEHHEAVISVGRYKSTAALYATSTDNEVSEVEPQLHEEHALVFANLDIERSHQMRIEEAELVQQGISMRSKYKTLLFDDDSIDAQPAIEQVSAQPTAAGQVSTEQGMRYLSIVLGPGQAMVLLPEDK